MIKERDAKRLSGSLQRDRGGRHISEQPHRPQCQISEGADRHQPPFVRRQQPLDGAPLRRPLRGVEHAEKAVFCQLLLPLTSSIAAASPNGVGARPREDQGADDSVQQAACEDNHLSARDVRKKAADACNEAGGVGRSDGVWAQRERPKEFDVSLELLQCAAWVRQHRLH